MVAEYLSKRGVHQVCCRMVQDNCRTPATVDRGGRTVTHRKLARLHAAIMHNGITGFQCIRDQKRTAISFNDARIPNLAATFGIKRRCM